MLVPVNWRLAPDEVAYILDDCSPKVLVHDDELASTTQALLDQKQWSGPVVALDGAGAGGYEARLDRAAKVPFRSALVFELKDSAHAFRSAFHLSELSRRAR